MSAPDTEVWVAPNTVGITVDVGVPLSVGVDVAVDGELTDCVAIGVDIGVADCVDDGVGVGVGSESISVEAFGVKNTSTKYAVPFLDKDGKPPAPYR